MRDPVTYGDLERAERVGAIVSAGRCHRVGDESDATGTLREHQSCCIGMHVCSVENELHRHPRIFECRNHRPGRAVLDPRHGVEDMSEKAGAVVKCGSGLFDCRFGVSDGDPDAGCNEVIDRLHCTGQLRRDGDLPKGSSGGGQEQVELRSTGIAEVCGVVRPTSRWREKGALEVRAEHTGIALNQVRDDAEVDSGGCERTGDEAHNGPCCAVSAVGEQGRIDRLLPVLE